MYLCIHVYINILYIYFFKAYQELGLLLVLVAVGILTYSSLVYFAEKDADSSTGDVLAVLNNNPKFCLQWLIEIFRIL